jgi:hypothetical protein
MEVGGDGSCYWDPDDSGDDQCSPNLGGGSRGTEAAIDANDSGPTMLASGVGSGSHARRDRTVSAQFRSAELRSVSEGVSLQA